MNRLTIIGGLTRDPEQRSTPNGSTVCTFSVAVNDKFKKDAPPIFFRVSAWNALGDNCAKFLRKGSRVAVEGSVSVHTFMTNDGKPGASLEVNARDVEFLSSNKREDSGAASDQQVSQPTFTDVSGAVGDDLPF